MDENQVNNDLNLRISKNDPKISNNVKGPTKGSVDKETELESENEVPQSSPDTSTNSTEYSGSSSYVIRMLTRAFRFLNLKRMVKNVQQGKSTPGACITCKFAMTMVKHLIDYGKGFKDVAYVTSYFCKTLNVQTARVCDGYVNSFMVCNYHTLLLYSPFGLMVFLFSGGVRCCHVQS